MNNGAVARRYAQAAFEISLEQQALDRWRDDISVIAEYFANHQLKFILGEPNVRMERKEAIVRDLLGEKVQPEALSFALVLTERNLVGLAPRIRDEFERLYDEQKGQTPALVTTAVPLDDATRARIVATLQAQTGKRILLEERVDPSILGGAIIRVGDTLMDGSIRQRLAILRQQIAQGAFGGPDDGLDGFSDLFVLPSGGPGGAGMPVTGNGGPGSNGSNGSNGNRPAGGNSGNSGNAGKSGPTSATTMAPRANDAPRSAPTAVKPKPTHGGVVSSSPNSNKKKRKR
jgi:F-type H+-transporting ATPase subunit delta